MTDFETAIKIGYQFSIHRRKKDGAIVIAVRKSPGNGARIFEQISPDNVSSEQAIEMAARAALRLMGIKSA